jgi:AmmeMemoRadiSam system protein B/AmmeMemoRadiSam system protein A
VDTARQPAVAGTFYPSDPRELEAAVRGYLREAATDDAVSTSEGSVKALIVPHAGYLYSGPVAGSAYRLLRPARARIRRVVLLGPSHRVALAGLAASSADTFVTPLGPVPIDREAVDRVLGLDSVHVFDRAHAEEHSLEVQVPFLQCALDDFSLVPLSVGDATPEETAAVLDTLWGGPETLIVVSTDLSHYRDYETARHLDEQTTRAIEELRPDDLGRESACGRIPVKGLLVAAQRRGLAVRTLDVRSSGDTVGRRDRVVGYGAYALEPNSAAEPVHYYPERDRQLLLDVARRSLECGAREARGLIVSVPDFPPRLRETRGSFVTLQREGRLRGCMGTLQAFRSLVVDVSDRAFTAGFRDPRFPPLTEGELSDLELEISVLSPLEPLPVSSEDDLLARMRPGVDGLMLQLGNARGTLLPSVWEKLSEPQTFLRHLKLKAGLREDFWSSDITISRYTTELIS